MKNESRDPSDSGQRRPAEKKPAERRRSSVQTASTRLSGNGAQTSGCSGCQRDLAGDMSNEMFTVIVLLRDRQPSFRLLGRPIFHVERHAPGADLHTTNYDLSFLFL